MSSNSTPAPTAAPPASKLSQFAVGSIPAFKQPAINYAAAAAAKAKPSPPAVNGKDVTATASAPSRKPAAAPAPAPSAAPPVVIEGQSRQFTHRFAKF